MALSSDILPTLSQAIEIINELRWRDGVVKAAILVFRGGGGVKIIESCFVFICVLVWKV